MLKSKKLRTWIVSLAAMLLFAVALLWWVYRPWALNWGATDEEIARAMPGDSIVVGADFVATRSVTIDAAPAEVWPWLVQIGYLRAGFYSHDRLDNDGVPSSDTIMPLYQGLRVGDSIPLSATGDAEVTLLEQNRFMLLVIEHGDEEKWTWVWGLYPDGAQTRLVSRLRVTVPSLRVRIMLDMFEIIMMKEHLLGMKERAEREQLNSRQPSAVARR
jgi:hypothetical protein